MTTNPDIRAARIQSLVDAHMTIPQKYHLQEPELLLRKWPIYRFLSPREATALFIDEYAEAYRSNYAKNVDRDEALLLRPVDKVNVSRNNSQYTQVWHARQLADFLGAPYPFFLHFCFEFASRRGNRKKPPRPNQLGPNKKTEAAWIDKFQAAWDDYKGYAFQTMEPIVQYTVDEEAGLPAQRQFMDELKRYLSERSGSAEFILEQRMVVLRQLPEDWCRSTYGDEAVDYAIKNDIRTPAQGGPVQPHYVKPAHGAMWQSCLGVVDINVMVLPQCEVCPQRRECEVVHKGKLQKVITKAKSVDPIREKQLADQRRHTQQCRARKKAAVNAAVLASR